MADNAQYIHELDLSEPRPDASAGEGDDQIRGLKRAVTQSMAGNGGGVAWDVVPGWNRDAPDRYDTPLLIGPRALNVLPAAMDEIGGNMVDLDSRVVALEAGAAGAAVIPVGVIAMWSGAIGAIPAKWVLCNGQNGAPDLRDRFIVAAGTAYTVGQKNTPAASTGAGTPHSHTGSTAEHVLTVEQIPAHGHPWYHKTNTENSTESQPSGGIVTGSAGASSVVAAVSTAPASTSGQQIGGAGGGKGHSHAFTGMSNEETHTHPIDVRPAFYALAFIMYKG